MASTFRERRFPPAEVRRILRRAAELAEKDPDTGGVEVALTQDEIARRAVELGLPASAVERAIGAPEAPAPDESKGWLWPRTVLFEQDIEGDLSPDHHEEIIEAIRAASGTIGSVVALGSSFSWSFSAGQKPLLTVESADGRVRVRAEERLNGASLLIVFGILSFFPSLTVLSSPDPSRWVGVALTLAGFLVFTLYVRRWVRRREAMIRRVMERTTAAVRAAVTPKKKAAPRARIDRSALDRSALEEAESAAEEEAAAGEAELRAK